jgi:hypothetical protein
MAGATRAGTDAFYPRVAPISPGGGHLARRRREGRKDVPSRRRWFLPVRRRAPHVQAAARPGRLYHSGVRGIASAFAAASMAGRRPEEYAGIASPPLSPISRFGGRRSIPAADPERRHDAGNEAMAAAVLVRVEAKTPTPKMCTLGKAAIIPQLGGYVPGCKQLRPKASGPHSVLISVFPVTACGER